MYHIKASYKHPKKRKLHYREFIQEKETPISEIVEDNEVLLLYGVHWVKKD